MVDKAQYQKLNYLVCAFANHFLIEYLMRLKLSTLQMWVKFFTLIYKAWLMCQQKSRDLNAHQLLYMWKQTSQQFLMQSSINTDGSTETYSMHKFAYGWRVMVYKPFEHRTWVGWYNPPAACCVTPVFPPSLSAWHWSALVEWETVPGLEQPRDHSEVISLRWLTWRDQPESTSYMSISPSLPLSQTTFYLCLSSLQLEGISYILLFEVDSLQEKITF